MSTPPLDLLIDASPAVHQRGGIGRYTAELTAALLDLPNPPQVRLFYNAAAHAHPQPPLDRLPARPLAAANKPWRAAVLLAHLLRRPQTAALGPADVCHATDHLLPYLPETPTVFTLHDLTTLIVPQTHATWNRLYLRLALPYFLRRADQIIVPSAATRADALRRFDLPPAKFHVIPEAASPPFQPRPPAAVAAGRARLGLPDAYLLAVGTIEPRKNLGLLLTALAALRRAGLRPPLLLAGRPGWGAAPFFRQLEALDLGDQVRQLDFVPEADLPALYRGATALVFPSLYEGFGLPVLEAMACGAPVLCANSSSLPEVAGEAARLLDPRDASAWAAALAEIWTDAARRAELRARGLVQAARFSWAETARQTAAVYGAARR